MAIVCNCEFPGLPKDELLYLIDEAILNYR